MGDGASFEIKCLKIFAGCFATFSYRIGDFVCFGKPNTDFSVSVAYDDER